MEALVQSKMTSLGFLAVGAVSPSAMQALARRVSFTLPKEYVEFLATTGGGQFTESVLCRCRVAPAIAVAGRTMFGALLGMSGTESIETVLRNGRELGMSPEMLPIADAAGGDYYCMRGPNSGFDIVYWDHDSGGVSSVAESFLDLIQRLERDTEGNSGSGRVRVRLSPDIL